MTAAAPNWRRILAQRVRRLTPEDARAILEAHARRGALIGDPGYKELTGGYSSQSVDFWVTMKLAQRAGLRKVV